MFNRRAIAGLGASLTLTMTATALPARADPVLGPETDIAGLKLSMTGVEAQRFVKERFGAVAVLPMRAGLQTNYFAKDTVIGFYFERQGAAGAAERFKILTDPNGLDRPILAIARYKSYGGAALPTLATSLGDMYGKYGRGIHPGFSSKMMDAAPYFSWIADRNFADHSVRTGCTRNYSLGSDVLYESTGVLNDYRGPEFAAVVSSGAFVHYVNLVSAQGQGVDISSCGLMFQVQLIRAPSNQDYISAMSERIVDLRRANAALKAFGDRFWVEEAANRKAKLNKDAGTKTAF
jgi:hypothetical protein